MPYRVGFDVGGTFTDFVLQSPSGDLLTAKRLTTYPDPSEACLAGLDDLLAQGAVSWSDVSQATHGMRWINPPSLPRLRSFVACSTEPVARKSRLLKKA